MQGGIRGVEGARQQPVLRAETKKPIPLNLLTTLLSSNGRNLKFQEAVKDDKLQLLGEPAMCKRVIEAAEKTIATIHETRYPTGDRWTAAMSVSDIYTGLLEIGTSDAQLAAIAGLGDPDERVQAWLIINLSQESLTPYIHEAIFDALIEPKDVDGQRQYHEQGMLQALTIIKANKRVGYDKKTGKVFASINRGFSRLISDAGEIENKPEKESLQLEYAFAATELHDRATTADISEPNGSRGLSDETKLDVAYIFGRKISDCIPGGKDGTTEEYKRAISEIEKATYTKVKHIVATAQEANQKDEAEADNTDLDKS